MGRRVWTPELVERLRGCAEADMKQAEAAEVCGFTVSGVKKAANRYGIKFNRHSVFVEGNTFGSRAKRHGPPPKPPTPKPVRQPPAPLPVDDADAIARYIAERGVTRCPPAFAAPSTQGALDDATAAARIRAVAVIDTRKLPGESRHQWYRRIGGTSAGRSPAL